MARLESGLSMRVVGDLGDLHELDAWRDTVETYHHVPQLLGEEALHCLLRLPDVKLRCPLTLLIQGIDLEPEPWHALKHSAGLSGYFDHALPGRDRQNRSNPKSR